MRQSTIEKCFLGYLLLVVIGVLIVLFLCVCSMFGWFGIHWDKPIDCSAYNSTPVRDLPATCLSHFERGYR